MRRIFLPLLLLVVALAASVQARRVDSAVNGTGQTSPTEAPELSTPILSARRAPGWASAPSADTALTQSVSAALSDVASTGSTCAIVTRDDTQLVAGNTAMGFPTGELQRLVTSVIINQVGSASGFRTTIALRRDAELVSDPATGGNRLIGNVYLIGGGDPGLATDDYAMRFAAGRSITSFDALVDDLLAEFAAR